MAKQLDHTVDRGGALCWGLLAVIVLVIAYDLWTSGYVGVVLGIGVLITILGPSITHRSMDVLVPWQVLLVAVVALLARQAIGWEPVQFVGNYLVIATIALVLAVEIHEHTRVEMNRPFATVFVAMVTMAVATVWALGRWSVDLVLGTGFIPSNEALMWELIAATAVGLGAGVLFDRYFRRITPKELPSSDSEPSAERNRESEDEPPADEHEHDDPDLSDRFGLSERRQRQLVRALQLGIVATIGVGLLELDLSIVLTGIFSLGVTFLPAILQRNPRVSMDVGLVLWISTTVFLHALGTAYLYGETFWWHNVTHTVSGSLVAAIGYGTFRGIDEYTSAVRFPSRFMFVLIVLFVVSVGVLWEIMEFATDGLMLALGADPVLAQYGLDDTMTDMLFNTFGAIVVATWGTAYLTGFVTDLRKQIDGSDVEEEDRS
ncbi:hypothetical protein GRS48_05440 [Halorubrum sp. JWXQ-INN 858]|uniref:hypothetical protein n=1 Tax=Halorubrum sp. JWXQ-INN 858 TaxID=2690782 RepID=UPI001358A177|nr:hypothetical protein [Halorubrum sp. JWXQ-INN 858]MWV64269.1 hypothetical protein [Halorubrum sp. JWXQ-INN 858]